LENGDIYSWGLGEYGSLGVGEFRSKYVPTKVLVPPTIKEINCGAMHSSFIDF
jgi:alpha-tubulin suppressor-like RCC1 family protein